MTYTTVFTFFRLIQVHVFTFFRMFWYDISHFSKKQPPPIGAEGPMGGGHVPELQLRG